MVTNRHTSMNRSILSLVAALFVLTVSASASIVVTLAQTGGDVSISFTGSLKVAELTVASNIGGQGHVIYPGYGLTYINGNSHTDNYTYACTWTSGSITYGGTTGTWASSTSGNLLLAALGFDPPNVGLTNYYVSGSTISGSNVFTATNYAALGIDPALFNAVFTFANGETISLTSAVPEPASCALVGGLGALLTAAFLRRRPRKGAVGNANS